MRELLLLNTKEDTTTRPQSFGLKDVQVRIREVIQNLYLIRISSIFSQNRIIMLLYIMINYSCYCIRCPSVRHRCKDYI